MNAMSVLAKHLFGVPEGSVLGPLLFPMLVLRTSDIVRQHNVPMHNFADDTQVYATFDHKHPSSVIEAVKSAECCTARIRIWMLRNRLKMNRVKEK